MRHLRKDYDAIQPWPIKRPHWARVNGNVVICDFEGPETRPIIPDEEPVFLLRGADPAAAEAVLAWADHAEQLGSDLAMIKRVREWAVEMGDYAAAHSPSAPDTPPQLLRP